MDEATADVHVALHLDLFDTSDQLSAAAVSTNAIHATLSSLKRRQLIDRRFFFSKRTTQPIFGVWNMAAQASGHTAA